METADIVVIGAGMAGASVAAALAATHRVILIEAEERPGLHSTGRSAALWSASYGPAPIRALTRAARAIFDAPGPEFGAHPILTPRGEMIVAPEDQMAAFAALAAELGPAVERIGAEEARRRFPLLRPGAVVDALADDSAMDIDVAALHAGFLRRFRARGGSLLTRAPATGLARDGAGWRVETSAGTVAAGIVVNAAGAWADEVAGRAGLPPLGLEPRRRTAAMAEVAAPGAAAWPMVVDAAESFYVKPGPAQFLISPADATPVPPHDVQPEEIDVATGIDRAERLLAIAVRRVPHRWAGLRSFLPDGVPAAGFDPLAPGFFWLAGQGGYGIQTAPALAEVAAALVRGEAVPAFAAAEGVRAADLAPARFRA